MSSLNFAIAMGRLTGDPELKHTASDLAFTRFSIAVDRIGKSAEKQTDFFNVVAWGSNAEFICKYFKKGSLIIIEARMQTGSYEGKDGIKRQTFDLVVNRVHFAGPKSQDDSSSDPSADFSGNAFSNSDNSAFSDVDDDDDDLPF
jgi:single-strand DNA-binding protein